LSKLSNRGAKVVLEIFFLVFANGAWNFIAKLLLFLFFGEIKHSLILNPN